MASDRSIEFEFEKFEHLVQIEGREAVQFMEELIKDGELEMSIGEGRATCIGNPPLMIAVIRAASGWRVVPLPPNRSSGGVRVVAHLHKNWESPNEIGQEGL